MPNETILKRVTSVFKKDKDKSNGVNGTRKTKSVDDTNGTNGNAPQNGTTNSQRVDNRGISGVFETNPTADPSDGPDHSINREGIAATLDKYAQVISFSARPLPTQTGDGSYIVEPKQISLWDDLKAMRIKDYETLDMTLKQELSGTKLTDDRSMLMEKTIQVSLLF